MEVIYAALQEGKCDIIELISIIIESNKKVLQIDFKNYRHCEKYHISPDFLVWNFTFPQNFATPGN